MKINFLTVHNDFGDTLPSKSDFFANPDNEVTRRNLRYYYGGKGATDLRRFKWFCKEYELFVSKLKADAAKAKAKPKGVTSATK